MFIEVDLESMLAYFDKLTPEQKPEWGKMSAQRMVEHLTDTLRIATGQNPQKLVVPEDKIDAMLRFLDSDKPMSRNIEVEFALPGTPLRNAELELAVDEFVDEWLNFEDLYQSNPGHTEVHSYYGPLNYEQWMKLHQKHFTHHLTQFGLI